MNWPRSFVSSHSLKTQSCYTVYGERKRIIMSIKNRTSGISPTTKLTKQVSDSDILSESILKNVLLKLIFEIKHEFKNSDSYIFFLLVIGNTPSLSIFYILPATASK